VAIDYALSWGLEAIWERITVLAENLRGRLEDLPGVTVHDLGRQRCGIVSFSVKDINPETIKRELAEKQINVSVSTQSSTLLDMEERGLADLVRASVHYYNSEKEVERFCVALQKVMRCP
jgi:selenocysteine lyase/cysteine desulfurase